MNAFIITLAVVDIAVTTWLLFLVYTSPSRGTRGVRAGRDLDHRPRGADADSAARPASPGTGGWAEWADPGTAAPWHAKTAAQAALPAGGRVCRGLSRHDDGTPQVLAVTTEQPAPQEVTA